MHTVPATVTPSEAWAVLTRASVSPVARQGGSRFLCLPPGALLRIHGKALVPPRKMAQKPKPTVTEQSAAASRGHGVPGSSSPQTEGSQRTASRCNLDSRGSYPSPRASPGQAGSQRLLAPRVPSRGHVSSGHAGQRPGAAADPLGAASPPRGGGPDAAPGVWPSCWSGFLLSSGRRPGSAPGPRKQPPGRTPH